MNKHHYFLNDYETKQKFPINNPYHIIIGYFYGMNLSNLLIDSLIGIKDRCPLNIDGNNCLFLGMDDYIDDFKDIYGYERAITEPTFYFSFGFDSKNQIIVSEKEAFEISSFVGKKFIEIYPTYQNIVRKINTQLQNEQNKLANR